MLHYKREVPNFVLVISLGISLFLFRGNLPAEVNTLAIFVT